MCCFFPPCRRGNWITLKLKKLMKSSSREQEPEQAAAPPSSDIAQTQPFCPDSGSCVSSEGSAGSSSTSAGDPVSPQRADCEYDLWLQLQTRTETRARGRSDVCSDRQRDLEGLSPENIQRYGWNESATVCLCVFKCVFTTYSICLPCVFPHLFYVFPDLVPSFPHDVFSSLSSSPVHPSPLRLCSLASICFLPPHPWLVTRHAEKASAHEEQAEAQRQSQVLLPSFHV